MRKCGSVSFELLYTSSLIFAIGSNVIVAGTAIVDADDPAAVIAQLKATVESAQAAARGA
jgi:3-keto-L-gulonate-6-phosphate decarboxylase